MAVIFPPSSPVAASCLESDPLEYEDKGSATRELKNSATTLQRSGRCYLTPDPSSSLGRSSSPIRATTAHDSSPGRDELPRGDTYLDSKPVSIELDPRDPSRLAIGRKHGVCDIILPSKKSISRQHAFISYLANNNQVKLECNGSNGCIVTLPRQLGCQLVKPDPAKACFELRPIREMDAHTKHTLHGKELVNDHLLTSFVLLKGEMVTMPYVKGTILDFRQAEAVLTMKQLSGSWAEDEDSATETEDEMVAVMTKSDDFHQVDSTPTKFATIVHSPATLQLSKRQEVEHHKPAVTQTLKSPLSHKPNQVEATPTASSVINTPATPTKPKKLDLLLNTQIRNQETPLSERSNAPPRRRNYNVAFTNGAESKPKQKNVDPKSKQRKVHSAAKTTADEIIDAMEQRGIKCIELQRILANHLAFANVLQTPLYQLQTVNSTISTLSRKELQTLLLKERCIGVIHRQGKDAAGKPLDEEYFYDVENDDDVERKNLVFSFKGGRSGLRSCRKVHKQYFWKKPAK